MWRPSYSRYISPSDIGGHLVATQLVEAAVRIRHDQAEPRKDSLFCTALLGVLGMLVRGLGAAEGPIPA